MSPVFIKDVRKPLPGAKITFDRFHILKLINEAVDQARREKAFSLLLYKWPRPLTADGIKAAVNSMERYYSKKKR